MKWTRSSSRARIRKPCVPPPCAADVEADIWPLVDTMNRRGLRTIASCQGHPLLYRSPYVYFAATVAQAAELERVLGQDAEADCPKLRMYWTVTGAFDGGFVLRFSLQSHQ